MKFEFSGHIFGESSSIKFYQNPCSGSRVVLCGRTDIKLILAFGNFVNAPEEC